MQADYLLSSLKHNVFFAFIHTDDTTTLDESPRTPQHPIFRSMPTQINAVLFFAILLTGPLYLVLSIVALFSTISPTLESLASHGKTRVLDDNLERGSANKRRDDLSSTPPLETYSENAGIIGSTKNFIHISAKFFLTSEKLMVDKSRFVDFYKVGIFATLIIHYVEAADSHHDKSGECFENDYAIGVEHFHKNIFMLLEYLTPWSLLLIHLSRRYYECKFVQKSTKSSQMHFAGYLLGVVHYLFLPFVFGNSSTGIFPHLVGTREGILASETTVSDNNRICKYAWNTEDAVSKLRISGIIFSFLSCIYFQYQQHRHHILLAYLRSNDENETYTKRKKTLNAKESDTYKIPTGGWFHLVSCPHYFSEILIYFCFALSLEVLNYNHFERDHVNSSDIAAIIKSFSSYAPFLHVFENESIINSIIAMYITRHWILLFWVATNLSISAQKSHEWYVVRFGNNYPSQRRRLVPHVW